MIGGMIGDKFFVRYVDRNEGKLAELSDRIGDGAIDGALDRIADAKYEGLSDGITEIVSLPCDD